MAADTRSLGKLIVELLLKDEDFDEGLKNAEKQVKEFGAGVGKLSSRITSSFVTAMKAATAAVAAFGAAATVVGSQFEQEIVTVAALKGLDQASEGFQQLTDRARELGAETAFSATQAAQGMQNLVRAGLDVRETIDTIGPALEFAGAAGASLEQSTAVLASTLRQFQLDAAQAGRISDVFSVALKESMFDVESLDVAMRFAGPAAAAFGENLEDTTAILAQFRNLGLEGSMVGTTFRGMLSSLAKPTAEATAAIEGMGLSVDDVNPNLHSMVEVLQTLADAGFTVNDSLAIFGRRFGGQVAAVVEQIQTGSSTMDSMIAQLQDSAGQAGDMYEQMQNTVVGQFRIMKSAAEELLLTVFETFRGPLRDLLSEMASTIQAVAAEFKRRSGGIAATFQETIGGLIRWLQENRFLIVQVFLDSAEAVAGLASMLATIAPLLDEIAMLAVAAFPAAVVFKMVSAVTQLVKTITTLRAAIIAGQTTMTVATGGIWAAVAAVGALVAALATLATSYSEAERAARALRVEQETGARVAEETIQRIQEDIQGTITATKEAESETRKLLAAQGELTDTRRAELDIIRSSTDAELALAVARGELVEHAGQLRTVASLYEELEEDAIPAVEAATRKLSVEQAELNKRASGLQSMIADFERFGDFKSPDLLAEAAGFAGGMVEVRATLAAVNQELERVDEAQTRIANSATDAEAALLSAYAGGQGAVVDLTNALGDLAEESKEAGEAVEEAWGKAISAMEEALQIRKRAAEELEDIQADEEESIRLSHQRELASLEESLGEALRATEGNEIARFSVLKQFADAREDIEKRHQIELTKFHREQLQERLKQERDASKKNFDERVRQMERARDAIERIEMQGLSASERILRERLAFFQEHTLLTEEQRRIAEEHFHRLWKEALQEEKEARRAALRETVGSATAAVAAVGSAVAEITSRVTSGALSTLGRVRDGLRSVVDWARVAAGAIGDVFATLTGGRVSLDPISFIQEALQEGGGANVAEMAVQFVQAMASEAATFAQALADALPAVTDALIAAIPEIVNAFAAALPAVVSALVSAIPVLAEAIAENLPIITTALAQLLPEVVRGLVSVMPVLVQAIAQNIGIIVDALADALPPLIQALADAIPVLVGVVVDNLPTIVQAIVDAVPVVAQALGETIPDLIQVVASQVPVLIQAVVDNLQPLVQGLVDAVPFIIQALVDGIPILVQGLVDNLPALLLAIVEGLLELLPVLIEQLPIILDAILELLPVLITAILEALPDIIVALAQAIPQIIDAVVRAVPDIITAIIAGIPDIIVAVVEQLPTLMVAVAASLIELIPTVIVAFVEAFWTELVPRIPDIAQSLVDGIWKGIQALGDTIKEWVKDLFRFFGGEEKDKSSAYSGISYVPATMRGVTLHKGEAVLTADENQRRLFGGAGGASASAPGAPVVSPSGGQGMALEALFAVDGRVVDGVLVRANQNGRGQTTRMVRRMAGVKSGVKTISRRNYWSK